MTSRICVFLVPERTAVIHEVVRLAPIRDDPDCWSALEGALLVVEDDRDAVYLSLLADEPLLTVDGGSALDTHEFWVPDFQREQFETAIRDQCTGRHEWLHILRVAFASPQQIQSFSQTLTDITGIPVALGSNGHHRHEPLALFR